MFTRLLFIGALCSMVLFGGCQTGVEPSPSPGIFRVTFTSNSTDTTIVIQSDTSRFSRWDEFFLTISQGRLFRGQNYAPLYATPGIERIPGATVNIIKRQWLDGSPIKPTDFGEIHSKNSRYVTYTVFESNIPPGEYDSLSFSLTGNEILVFIPKVYMNPVQLPPGTHPQMVFPAKITVKEGQVTQVNFEVFPFSSLSRYRDSYLFSRKVQLVNIENL